MALPMMLEPYALPTDFYGRYLGTDIEHPTREKFGKDSRLVLQTGVVF